MKFILQIYFGACYVAAQTKLGFACGNPEQGTRLRTSASQDRFKESVSQEKLLSQQPSTRSCPSACGKLNKPMFKCAGKPGEASVCLCATVDEFFRMKDSEKSGWAPSDGDLGKLLGTMVGHVESRSPFKK